MEVDMEQHSVEMVVDLVGVFVTWREEERTLLIDQYFPPIVAITHLTCEDEIDGSDAFAISNRAKQR